MLLEQIQSNYYNWNKKVELKNKNCVYKCSDDPITSAKDNMSYIRESKFTVNNKKDLYKSIDLIYQLITGKSEISFYDRVLDLKERVVEITKTVFGLEISTTDVDKTVYFPNGRVSIKLETKYKIAKDGMIKFNIENYKLGKTEYSTGCDEIDRIIEQLKKFKEGKIKIDYIKVFLSKLEKEEDIVDVYMNFNYVTLEFEYVIELNGKFNEYYSYDAEIIYKFHFNDFNPQEVIATVPALSRGTASQIIASALKVFEDKMTEVLVYLQNNFRNLFNLFMQIMIAKGIWKLFEYIPNVI